MLRTAVICISGIAVCMRTGFGKSALGTGISAENMVTPPGISVPIQFLTAGITGGIIAVHIAVFIGVDRFCTGMSAFFLIPANCTFVGTVETVVFPSGIAPSFGDRAAFRTLGLVAVHLLVFDGVHLRVTVGTGGEYRHRQDGHDHQNGEKRAQNFCESFCHTVIPFVFVKKKCALSV